MRSDRPEGPVFRARNPADELTVMIARTVAEQPGLSLTALGTYTALMAYRDGGAVDSMTALAAAIAADRAGVNDVLQAMVELRDHGIVDFADDELAAS